ncbi:MAG: hypothetical protein GQ531_06395 [Sulfurovum sp.]|nr:hypothetical protein [Sulfurovum sp.]
MKSQNLFTMTLIISGLALTPVYALRAEHSFRVTQTAERTLSTQIILDLTQRGLEQQSAEALVFALLRQVDETELETLIGQLQEQNIVKPKEVYAYVASLALHKQNMDFSSYDALLGLVMQIQGQAVDEKTCKQLSLIVKSQNKRFT